MADILPFKPMLVHAQAEDQAADTVFVTRPCPFCGERENLFCGEEEKHLGMDDDGKPMIETIPTVFCDVCDASAPVDTWNGQFSPKGAA